MLSVQFIKQKTYVLRKKSYEGAGQKQEAADAIGTLVLGTLAPLHRSLWQQLTSHFLIVADGGTNNLQISSVHLDLRAHPL